MVWAKVSDTFYDDPVLLKLPRNDRLFLVEATTWCCKHETDGLFPLASVGRFSDTPDPGQTLARLADAGLLDIVPDGGYTLTGFLDEQRSKERIDADRAEARFRQERKRLHDKGDHSKCTRGSFCPVGELEYVSHRDQRAKSRGESQPPDLTCPDPQGRDRKAGADALPPKGSAALAPKALKVFAMLERRSEADDIDQLVEWIGHTTGHNEYSEFLAIHEVLSRRSEGMFPTTADLAQAIADRLDADRLDGDQEAAA
jgi:hypothetical protein